MYDVEYFWLILIKRLSIFIFYRMRYEHFLFILWFLFMKYEQLPLLFYQNIFIFTSLPSF